MLEYKIIDALTPQIKEEIVNRIVQAISPEKIILFGSYAYGNPDADSDVDILVIMKSNLPRHKRSIPVYNALRGLIIPKDIVVYTPEEIEEWANVPQSFVKTIMNKGKILYEK